MKNLIIILILTLFFSSCKKDIKTFNLKGRIVLCFNGIVTPYANKPIDLFQTHHEGDFKSKVLQNTTTDADGNFEFTYSADIAEDKLAIRASSGFGFVKLISGIPLQNISDLKVYYAGRYNLNINLNVINSYTNADTLYLSNSSFQNFLIKFAGPFSTGTILSLQNVTTNGEMKYGFNTGNLGYKISRNGSNEYIYKDYPIENNKLCGDTVVVTLDIR